VTRWVPPAACRQCAARAGKPLVMRYLARRAKGPKSRLCPTEEQFAIQRPLIIPTQIRAILTLVPFQIRFWRFLGVAPIRLRRICRCTRLKHGQNKFVRATRQRRNLCDLSGNGTSAVSNKVLALLGGGTDPPAADLSVREAQARTKQVCACHPTTPEPARPFWKRH